MKTQRGLAAFAIATLCLVWPAMSHAQVHWEFNEPVHEVATGDRIVLYATFFNDSASHVITDGVGGSFAGDLNRYYDVHARFGSPFVGLDLPPGESFEFVFALLIPREIPWNGHVPAGVYFSDFDETFINVNGVLIHPDNGLEIRVTGVPPNFAIPEPGTLPFVAGLAGAVISMAWYRRRRLSKGIPAVAI